MAEPIYFQWQNDALRKTIYPARDMKLRHFLLYYKEIDLWAKYKDKKIADCQKEKAEYEGAQKKTIIDAFNDERKWRDYFTTVQDIGSEDGKDETAEFNNLRRRLHDDFRMYFDIYEKKEKEASARDRKEKIFVAMRVAEWEQRLKEMKQKIAKKKNLLDDPKAIDKEKKGKELKVLEDTVLSGIKDELEKLKLLVSAQNRLEKRKAEFAKRQKELLKQQDDILKDLGPLERLIKACEADQKKVEAWIARLRNPPDLKEILDYFSKKADIYADIRERFDQDEKLQTKKSVLAKGVLARVIDIFRDTLGDATHSFHDELLKNIKNWIGPEKRDPDWILQWIGGQAATVQKTQKKLDDVIRALEEDTESMRKSVPEGSTHISGELTDRLQVLNILRDTSEIGIRTRIVNEWDKLEDLRAAINHLQRPDKLGSLIDDEKSELETRLKKLLRGKELSKCLTEEADLRKQLKPVETDLQITREKYLSEYVPDQPVNETQKDLKKAEEKLKEEIVQFLADKYYVELLGYDHDRLLHEVFQRFWDEPERFPPWLQYMVIHFSGMRYASAHGSWADPKDLLQSLRMQYVQEELKDKDEATLKGECDGRVAAYEGSKRGEADPALYLPKLAQATDKNSKDNHAKDKMEHYLAALNSEKPSDRREAFFNLRVEEEYAEINAMTTEEALDELKLYKDKLDLPPEMWKEIVKLTDLRLTEVTSEDWETLTPEEQKARLSSKDKQMWKYNEIMSQWKAKHLTGWREAHHEANRLVVTRAVCNEVAEHIQHLRGHKGAAGLTQKPNWYRVEEDKYHEALKKGKRIPRSYFVRARKKEQFNEGASILWLRFVHEVPNDWRVARDLETREGDRLIPNEYLGRKAESGGWAYEMGDVIKRTRTAVQKKASQKGPKENQWLRWMHEATVAAVEEINEQTTMVLTFETALPYEDPSLSTIGLFKRYLHHLTDDLGEDAYNPAFVGFVPEGEIPASDLEEMLNWNHILRKEVVSPAALEAWREKYIRKRKPPVIEVIDTVEPVKGKADLPICNFVKWTDSLAIANKNLYKVRIWGDKKLHLDINTASTDSNFQAVGVYVKEISQRGGVSNFLKIERDDIDKLIAMQIEDEFRRKRSDPKRPKFWLEQKMNWLCKKEGTIYFTKDGKGWETAPSILWGTIALGGNLVQVEGEEEIEFKVEGGEKRVMRMARLAGFKKTDWHRPLDELLAEGLVHRCFCVYKGNKPIDTPQGIVYSPFFSPRDWDFAGQAKPQALYLPFDHLVKPDEKDYVGIFQRLKCKDEE